MTGLTCCLVASAGLPAQARPRPRYHGPSAHEVAQARSKAVERSKQVGAATALLDKARARLKELTAQARILATAAEATPPGTAPPGGPPVRTAPLAGTLPPAGPLAGIARLPDSPAGGVVPPPGALSVPPIVPAEPLTAPAGLSQPLTALTGPLTAPAGSAGHAEPLGASGEAHVLAAASVPLPDSLPGGRGSASAASAAAPGLPEATPVTPARAVAPVTPARAAADRAQATVAAQTAEVRRLQRERDRLLREARVARDAANRLADDRETARERFRVARDRARYGGYRAAAMSRQRARALVARRRPAPSWALDKSSGSGPGDIAADWALTQIDKPYVWAGSGPGSYDCSGLTMRAWERAGVKMPHWTGTQWSSGRHVRLGRLRRGDLLFFGRRTRDPGDIRHVGLYIGRGLMVHAPRTGDVVRVAPMWRGDLIGATRPA